MKYEKITKHEAVLKAKELLDYHPNPPAPENKPGPKELPELTPEDHQRILTESFSHFCPEPGGKTKESDRVSGIPQT